MDHRLLSQLYATLVQKDEFGKSVQEKQSDMKNMVLNELGGS